MRSRQGRQTLVSGRVVRVCAPPLYPDNLAAILKSAPSSSELGGTRAAALAALEDQGNVRGACVPFRVRNANKKENLITIHVFHRVSCTVRLLARGELILHSDFDIRRDWQSCG